MPARGQLAGEPLSEIEQSDLELGIKTARMTSDYNIGQTVIVKSGTILSVEAFEGTDAAIERAGGLGGKGSTVVKLAKSGHDMRFDIPVLGLQTLKTLNKAGVSLMAVEEGRCIVLEKDAVIAQAKRQGLKLVVVASEEAQ